MAASGRWLMAVLLLSSPAWVAAQDWSGASLRGATRLAAPAGYLVETLATGLRLPQDLAFDPPDGLWVLTADPARGAAGVLVRVPLGALGPEPVDASRLLRRIPIPFPGPGVRFTATTIARHPRTGDFYVAESSGQRILRVSPSGETTLYAQGGNALADSRGLAFDTQARLVVLDFAGRSLVADAGTDPLRALLGQPDAYQGPVVYRLDVDEPLPLPRSLEYVKPVFPLPSLRRQGTASTRYRSVAPLPSGDIVLAGAGGAIDRLHPGGTISPMGRVTQATAVVVGARGEILVLDYLGGRIDRARADGSVERFVEGLVRPAAIAVATDGAVFVAEDSGRLLAIRPEGVAP